MALKMDHAVFFAQVRRNLFGGSLTQSQVEGMDHTLAEFEVRGSGDRRHLAYIMATDYHETGRRMQPVREGFAKDDAGARAAVAKLYRDGKIKTNYAAPGSYGNSFYGRGDVQLTHEANYKKLGDILGIDLVKYPDSALDPFISKRILVEGMLRGASNRGDFTKYALEDFISGAKCDYLGARKVVNGTDKAALIASYASAFESALITAGLPLMSKGVLMTSTRPVLPAETVAKPAIPVETPRPTPGVVQPPAPVATGGFWDRVGDRLRTAFPKKDA